MRLEISYLVALQYADDVVQHQEIGDGVIIENLSVADKKARLYEVLKVRNEDHYNRLVFREDLEHFPYTHRFLISVDGIRALDDPSILDAQQLLVRAIVLARMVRPISIPLYPSSIRCFYDGDEILMCFAWTYVGFYSEAYVGAKLHPPKLTESDAQRMQAYWTASQFLHSNRLAYRRIYRALYMFNDACHIRPLNIRHVVLHAVLESLICTSRNNNRAQVVQRLPQLTGLDTSEAEAIYDLCADIKHSAAPNFLNSPDLDNLTPSDQQREQATLWLEAALSELFRKILDDNTLAQDLFDRQKLMMKYPVKNRQGKLV
ncbi:MAG TPA: hypothetical protein VF397_14120 [Pyrinomonadaceae bacterium]